MIFYRETAERERRTALELSQNSTINRDYARAFKQTLTNEHPDGVCLESSQALCWKFIVNA
ncbi:MAG: hypothetical protein IJ599_03005 [Alphaproteobacteria bacterium]|nr:hypothetical protein [Alphaproteobacteria bacterium]